jgi:hypothetical protein
MLGAVTNWASGVIAESDDKLATRSNEEHVNISMLLERIRVSANVPDRHTTLLELKGLTTTHKGVVEIGEALDFLLSILADTDDGEITQCVLEILDEVCSIEPVSDNDAENAVIREAGLANISKFLAANEFMEMLLNTIAVDALWVRLAALSLLITLTRNAGEPAAQAILQCAEGMAKVMKAIDDTREAVQSSALHLLVLLTDEKGVGQASVEVASFVAFQDGFHVLLRVMTQEKLATDSPLVLDALRILMQMLTNQIVQKLFLTGETIESYFAALASVLKPTLARSPADGEGVSLGGHIMAAVKSATLSTGGDGGDGEGGEGGEGDEGGEGAQSSRSEECSVECAELCLRILKRLLESDREQRQRQEQLGDSSFIVAAVCQLAFAPTITGGSANALQRLSLQVLAHLVHANPKNAAIIAAQPLLSSAPSTAKTTSDELVLELELDWKERELAAFYCCHEPSKMRTACSLLRDYPFADLRGSLHAKYAVLPAGWEALTYEGRMQAHELQAVRGLFSLVALWLHASPSEAREGPEQVWQLMTELFSATAAAEDEEQGCSWLAMVLVEESICRENLVHRPQPEAAAATESSTPVKADAEGGAGNSLTTEAEGGSIRDAVGAYIGSNFLLSAAVGAAKAGLEVSKEVTKAGLEVTREATSTLQPAAAEVGSKVSEKSKDLLSFGIGLGKAALAAAAEDNFSEWIVQQPDTPTSDSSSAAGGTGSTASARTTLVPADDVPTLAWGGPWPLSGVGAPCSGLLVIDTLIRSSTATVSVDEEDGDPQYVSWQWQACRLLGAILSASGRVGRKLALQILIEMPHSHLSDSQSCQHQDLFSTCVALLARATGAWKPITNPNPVSESENEEKQESSSSTTTKQVSLLLLLCHWCLGSAEACYTLLRKPSHWFIVDIAAASATAGGTTSNLVSELACLLVGICWLELPTAPAGAGDAASTVVSVGAGAGIDSEGCLHPTAGHVRTAVETRIGIGAFTRRVELLPASLRGWVGDADEGARVGQGGFSLCGQEVPLSATACRLLELVMSEQYSGASESVGPTAAAASETEVDDEVKQLREENAQLKAKVARLQAQQRKQPKGGERKGRERRSSKEPKARERRDSRERNNTKEPKGQERRDSRERKSGRKGKGKDEEEGDGSWWPDEEGGKGGDSKGGDPHKGAAKEVSDERNKPKATFTVTGLKSSQGSGPAKPAKPAKPPTHPASVSSSSGEARKDKPREPKEDPTAFKGARKERTGGAGAKDRAKDPKKGKGKPKPEEEESWWPEEGKEEGGTSKAGAKGRGQGQGGKRR